MGVDRAGRLRTTQPGNCKQVMVIKAINALGFAIPPLVIFKVVMHQAAWYANSILLPDWAIGVSKNGQTTNEISLWWLQHFNKYIKDCTIGRYWLLILNGYSSYINPKFDQYCLEHLIIVLYILAYLLYLLQPLNISCFLVLKRLYRSLVEQKMGFNINYINKQEFLFFYQQARIKALYKKNIRSGFAAVGFMPYKPDYVLSLLHV